MWACASQAFGGGRSPGAEGCATGPAMRGGSFGNLRDELIRAGYLLPSPLCSTEPLGGLSGATSSRRSQCCRNRTNLIPQEFVFWLGRWGLKLPVHARLASES